MKTPEEIVDLMRSKDAFSSWLGIELLDLGLGFCNLKCTVKSEMLNGFEIAHGGITYSLADSALAFASNSRGVKCVSIETSISHVKVVRLNDELTARCNELHRGKTIGIYQVEIHNQEQKLIGLFKGTVHVSGDLW